MIGPGFELLTSIVAGPSISDALGFSAIWPRFILILAVDKYPYENRMRKWCETHAFFGAIFAQLFIYFPKNSDEKPFAWIIFILFMNFGAHARPSFAHFHPKIIRSNGFRANFYEIHNINIRAKIAPKNPRDSHHFRIRF